MKRILLTLMVAALAFAQQAGPVTLPDISGGGGVTQVAASGTARWITFYAPPSNSATNCGTSAISGCIRIGDASISTTRGYFIQPGQSAYVPESAGASRIALASWYYLVQAGDKLVITYGQ